MSTRRGLTLSGRMWLTGAVLPVAVMALVLAAADRLFHLALERSLDQALLAQAAVESVSLFDGDENPHLHMARSPLVESVRPFAPEGVLFGPDGQEVMRSPPGPAQVDRQPPLASGAPPSLQTVERDGTPVRRLLVSINSPEGAPYTLQLSASVAQIEASAERFHWAALFATCLAAVVLVLVQWLQSRRLRARLASLQRHLEAVEGGDLDQLLPQEPERDEVTALRDVLARATAQLKQARAVQERLLADAAHELRTPLTTMRTGLDLALRRERPAEELKSALREAREEVDRLATLATRLLDAVSISKSETHAVETDLVSIAREAAAAHQRAFEAQHLTLRLECPEQLNALAHSSSVRQALDNLLSNALKFAPAKTEVVIALRTAGPGAWSLSVRDAGPGIAEPDRDSVFEPFHRAHHASAGGTGLGLTIVREVARQHHGTARVVPQTPGVEVVIDVPAGTQR